MILDIPRFKCYTKSEYLSDNQVAGKYIEAYAFAVTLIESRTILWTVHTIDGAVYSRLPTKAIFHQIPEKEENFKHDIFGAISSDAQVVEHQYLKDYMVEVLQEDGTQLRGVYKFTIDYFTGGFAQDPEQHKTSNIIFMDNGHIFIGPNNMLLFKDTHFTKESGKEDLLYRRNSTYYYMEDYEE